MRLGEPNNFGTGGGMLPGVPQAEAVMLSAEAVRGMRHRLHELANVFTGVMISSGLLLQQMEPGPLRDYAGGICECGDRGSDLVREIRAFLLEACGETQAPRGGEFQQGARSAAVTKAMPEGGEE